MILSVCFSENCCTAGYVGSIRAGLFLFQCYDAGNHDLVKFDLRRDFSEGRVITVP